MSCEPFLSVEERIRWARKVPQDKIWRLYQNDARGTTDETLVDDVGLGLFLRCQSLVMVYGGRVKCPRCRTDFRCVNPLVPTGTGEAMSSEVEALPCPACGWTTTKKQYHHSWKHADLNGTRAMDAFQAFVAAYPRAQSARERVVLIDRLIHAFHHSLKAGSGVPHRSAANNLVEGSHENVVAFLDRLTYGEASTPGLAQTRERWQDDVQTMRAVRRGERPGRAMSGERAT